MKKSLKEKINDFFFLDDEEMNEEAEQAVHSKPTAEQPKRFERRVPENSRPQTFNKKNVISMNPNANPSNSKIAIVEPRFEMDAESIADMLLDGESVVINVRRMDQNQAVKMINFLQGTIYAISGDMERIGKEIFVCAPQDVDIVLSELEVNESDFFNVDE